MNFIKGIRKSKKNIINVPSDNFLFFRLVEIQRLERKINVDATRRAFLFSFSTRSTNRSTSFQSSNRKFLTLFLNFLVETRSKMIFCWLPHWCSHFISKNSIWKTDTFKIYKIKILKIFNLIKSKIKQIQHRRLIIRIYQRTYQLTRYLIFHQRQCKG